MNGGLVVKRDQELTTGGLAAVPAVVMAAGKKAGLRFIEFFTANIRNANTRRAYHRACCDFFRWCESRGLELEKIGPVHVAAYIEKLQRQLSRPSVKLQLPAGLVPFSLVGGGPRGPRSPRPL